MAIVASEKLSQADPISLRGSRLLPRVPPTPGAIRVPVIQESRPFSSCQSQLPALTAFTAKISLLVFGSVPTHYS